MKTYTSCEEFVSSKHPILDQKPTKFYIEKGEIFFWLELDGETYYGVGSHCEIGDYSFDIDNKLSVQCDFDNFYLTRLSDSLNEICSWY